MQFDETVSVKTGEAFSLMLRTTFENVALEELVKLSEEFVLLSVELPL